MLIDVHGPSGVIWAAISFPFCWRYLVAAMVWMRVRGVMFLPANLPPRVEVADFPRPNSLLRESLTLAATNAIGIPIALLLAPTLSSAAPPGMWFPTFLLLATVLVVALYRRLRQDDRRWLAVKLDRIAHSATGQATFNDAD